MKRELLAKQPHDQGEVVFDAPWQARAFAMAVQLNESGFMSWSDWATLFSDRIKQFEKESEITSSDDYYELWLEALEEMTVNKT